MCKIDHAKTLVFVFAIYCVLISVPVGAEEIGSVDSRLRWFSPDDTIRVAGFEDPKVEGVVCYLSRAQVGGYAGALGFAEDPSDASIECSQVGPIRVLKPFEKGEKVFRERRSLIFKSLKVIRYCDETNNVLLYLVYSEKVIEGSPKNSVSAVPIRPWSEDAETPLAKCEYTD